MTRLKAMPDAGVAWLSVAIALRRLPIGHGGRTSVRKTPCANALILKWGKFLLRPDAMKPQLKIEIAEEPKPNETEFIVQQLLQFNSRCVGEGGFRQLAVFLRNLEEDVVGGLIGSTYWQWLYVDVF